MSIQVKNISKRYGSQLALDQLSFEVRSGEVLGFLGPNGAGKSTLMKILTGYLPADSGQALIDGQQVDGQKAAFRAHIGYLPEHNPLYPEMYIREYLHLAAGFYRLKNKKQQVERVIEMTGLGAEASKKIGALSKGYRQRVGLAQALIHDPGVLILDEATTGLDPNQLEEIRQLVRNISKEKTVMLSTHIMQEVEAVCNRVIIIHKGQLVAEGPTSKIRSLSTATAQQVKLAVLETINAQQLEMLPFVATAEALPDGEWLIHSDVADDIRPLLFREAVKRKWTIITLSEQARSVENVFRELTR
ncbi:ATP-binding cassette domain-containing protein [Roseimarinus sediminis]|uniref:ATP-binding cassette domain-containing protein n=1 Tax=Roseimarinus sediminis TaxID=1610899 RepID=UPI003D192A15